MYKIHKYGDTIINPEFPFTLNGINYSPNFLNIIRPDEVEALNVQTIVIEPNLSEKFYTLTVNYDNNTYVVERHHIQTARINLISEIKKKCASLISPTDWVMIRYLETNKPIDEKIRSFRETVRNLNNQYENEINNSTTLEQIQTIYENITWPTLDTFIPSVAEAKLAKIKTIWDEMWYRLENYEVMVDIGGTNYNFGCDEETRENITGINVAIARGLPIPNPRQWTPRNSLPINVSHNDLALIGETIMAQKDLFIYAYFTHKFAVNVLDTIEQIQLYNYKTGWPS